MSDLQAAPQQGQRRRGRILSPELSEVLHMLEALESHASEAQSAPATQR